MDASRSAMMSFTLSMPMDKRTSPSLMFARCLASGPILAWVMLAG